MSTITLTTTQHAMLDHAIHHTDGRVEWFPENIKGGARQKVLQGLFNRALITPHGSDWLVAAEGYDAMGCARAVACSIAPDPAPDHELDAAVAQAEAAWVQGVDTAESAPADQAESGDIAIETESQVDQNDNATGCDDCISGTDVPATEIDATQGQPLPTAAPAEQPLAKAIRTREHSKQATIIGMLQRAEGATIAQICEATGWQAHTVRGTFAGAFKKKLGLTITSAKPQGGERSYRVVASTDELLA
ncbi:DUF3489 domain-containing protein [Rhodoferax sp.]|uniref:DUF3489 domain-containing protein n=1 Tax=Rhodoferax sp. TaxID=50421 RepID=UPI002614CCF4|nr:DUF3489 domain-containing protein [Rhodoferax sp.]MDD2809149.1 DUF3489 domain-containing protein [Rhodoferax sp.]MDD4943320.1 DUF3489 domain-containing protein [Rhodoferax sp.]